MTARLEAARLQDRLVRAQVEEARVKLERVIAEADASSARVDALERMISAATASVVASVTPSPKRVPYSSCSACKDEGRPPMEYLGHTSGSADCPKVALSPMGALKVPPSAVKAAAESSSSSSQVVMAPPALSPTSASSSTASTSA